MSLYDFTVNDIEGNKHKLSDYKGKVLLIVNTASKCGFTPQFEGLEELNQQYKDQGLRILGFPCNQFLHQDPGTNEEILEFCTLHYGVSFDMFSKLNVKGKEQHPLYEYLVEHSPVRTGKKVKWNFEKFLIDQKGHIVNRFKPKVKPSDLKDDIEALL